VASQIDVRHLAPQVRAPTLVLHCTEDAMIPFAEGRLLAGLIPGARLAPLRSRNHIPLEGEPAWGELLDTLKGFLS
jgi:pimeloyl-ACP methyl ester carboxylesterase